MPAALQAFVQDSARLLASLAAAQLMALPFAGTRLCLATKMSCRACSAASELHTQCIRRQRLCSATQCAKRKPACLSRAQQGSIRGAHLRQVWRSRRRRPARRAAAWAPTRCATFGAPARALHGCAWSVEASESTPLMYSVVQVTAESIEKISAYASDEDKFSPGVR